MIKKTLHVDGIHCASCAMLIEGELEDIGAAANCSWTARKVEVSYDPAKLTDTDIHAAIARAGYRVSSE
jgi:copper chaperone CopZ